MRGNEFCVIIISPAALRYLRSRPYRKADDLLGAFSGDWFDRSGGYGSSCCCGGGGGSGGGYGGLFSDGTLFALLAAAGLAFYILYTAVTAAAAAAGGRRKKRSLIEGSAEEKEEETLGIQDILFHGRSNTINFSFNFNFLPILAAMNSMVVRGKLTKSLLHNS